MQLMTWTLARLGSRFSLLIEPHHRRIRHSALGGLVDKPTDLMVGFVEPDGTERVLPFTTRGTPLDNPEQFERLNSVTYRGYSSRYRLRFELNFHSVFYPQDETLCTIPVFYLEMRITPAKRVRSAPPAEPLPSEVKLFIRINRPDTIISATAANLDGDRDSRSGDGHIDLTYRSPVNPTSNHSADTPSSDPGPTVEARERIVSINPGCEPDPDGRGMTLVLPVTEPGSGIKWRLLWAAYCDEPLPAATTPNDTAKLKYTQHWPNFDDVIDNALRMRDDRLAHSRRLEKLIEQTPLSMSQRHLLNQSFQAFLANTHWWALDDESDWFTVSQGPYHHHAPIDGGYRTSLWYLTLWPKLLTQQLDQWTRYETSHTPSGGAVLTQSNNPAYQSGQSPLETTCNYLLLIQAYTRWTGDLSTARRHAGLIERLAAYITWTDRDNSGFPRGETLGLPDLDILATDNHHKYVHLAIKRIAALQAASDLLNINQKQELAQRIQETVDIDTAKIENLAWLDDHYAAWVDPPSTQSHELWESDTTAYTGSLDREAYTIRTADALLLPAIVAQPLLLDLKRLQTDTTNATRETLAAYGCGNTTNDIEDIWISQNLWRDHLAWYLGCGHSARPQRYWDLQVTSNTHLQSLGYCDTYLGNDEPFNPLGVASFGLLLAKPRLVINRHAPGGQLISVEPDRQSPQRWPLLPLADWKAGKIPVCVVTETGHVTIEGESDPVIIHGDQSSEPQFIG